MFVVCGCGSVDSDRLAIKGNVTLGGEPLAGGSISFVPLNADGISAAGMIVSGQFTIPHADGPSPGEFRVEILYFAETGRMVADTDAPGQQMAETRQVVPAKYNFESTLKVQLNADNAENLEFKLDAR
jgi:hypothetical protein